MSRIIFEGNHLIPTQISQLRQFSSRAKPDTINLGLGKPFVDTPLELKELAKKVIDTTPLDYSDNAGTKELRQAMAKKFSLSIDHICVTHGAQEGLMSSLMGLLNPGDEVLISDPAFVAYKTMITMLGGVPRTFELKFHNQAFIYDVYDILKNISEKTKIVLLGRLANPTGSDLKQQEIIFLASELRKKNILLIADEVYSELHFTEAYIPAAKMGDNIISINSLSKSHALTGWRLGYVLCQDESLLKKIIVAHQYIGTCATRISQNLAQKIFEDDVLYHSIIKSFKDYYFKSFDIFLANVDLKTPKPQGSFYLFQEIPAKFKTDFEFAEYFLQHENILVLPGSIFGDQGKRFVRIALSIKHDQIKLISFAFKKYY
jgi:aspartate/methionine/tyrosine aminotransferase